MPSIKFKIIVFIAVITMCVKSVIANAASTVSATEGQTSSEKDHNPHVPGHGGDGSDPKGR